MATFSLCSNVQSTTRSSQRADIAAPNFEPMLLLCRPHLSLQAKYNGDVLTMLKLQIYHQTMTKSRHRFSLCSRFAGLPSRLAKTHRTCTVRSSLRMHLYDPGLGPGNLVCAYGTTILTNRESSELVGECIFYALQVKTQAI